ARTSTEERRQQGISLLLADIDTPGIRISPIHTLDEKHHTNEVFLDDVRIPATNLVGEEGMGWAYGKVLLDRERMVAAATAMFLPQTLRAVRAAAARRRTKTDGGIDHSTGESYEERTAGLNGIRRWAEGGSGYSATDH
ncbi:MAG: hypothetical protein U0974_16175, partial [Gemmatimonadales bacterium]|nr:hypothetical protein [Gemmatimonadales bacterium]